MKRLVCLLLVVGLVATGAVAYARYAHIDELTSGLSISSGNATCKGFVSADCSTDTCNISIVLKRSTNGSTWSTYAGPWTGTGKGLTGASKSATVSVESGYFYKVVATGTIYQGSSKVDSDSLDSPRQSY